MTIEREQSDLVQRLTDALVGGHGFTRDDALYTAQTVLSGSEAAEALLEAMPNNVFGTVLEVRGFGPKEIGTSPEKFRQVFKSPEPA